MVAILYRPEYVNTMYPRRYRHHFSAGFFKFFVSYENMLYIWLKFIITSAMAKVIFSSLSVACLFVCLSVGNITEKRRNGFSWNFQRRWDLIQGTIGNIFRMFHLTSWTQDFFPHFFRAIHASLQHCRKTVEHIFMKFSEKDGHDTGSNLENFWDVTVNPLNPGSIYLFPGPVFVCNIMGKRSWFFYETSGMTQEIIT